MRFQLQKQQRPAANIVEFALVSSLTVVVILGLLIGALGVYRYQQVAHLAREGARHASTHGGKYAAQGMPAKTGVPAISDAAGLRTYLVANCAVLDPASLQVGMSYSSPGTLVPRNMPTYVVNDPNDPSPGRNVATNYVTVTVSYQWFPEMFILKPITLSSTSTMAMSY